MGGFLSAGEIARRMKESSPEVKRAVNAVVSCFELGSQEARKQTRCNAGAATYCRVRLFFSWLHGFQIRTLL
jgi:hypothetical protein